MVPIAGEASSRAKRPPADMAGGTRRVPGISRQVRMRVRSRLGLTLVEMLLVVGVVSILTLIIAPVISRATTRAKVDEATGVVAADLEHAIGLAGRLRKPMTLMLEGTDRYVVKDRATAPADTVRLRRNLAFSSDQGVRSLTLTPTRLTIFPNGLVSAALTVTIGSDGYSRQVTLSPAGQVRVLP